MLTTLRQALRVGRRIRTLGRVNPWSLNGVSSSGGSSAEPSLTLLLTMTSRVLYVRVFLELNTCRFDLLHVGDILLVFVGYSDMKRLDTVDPFRRR